MNAHRVARRGAFILFMTAWLLPCNADDAGRQTTTLGTRASQSQPNPPITSNIRGSWGSYSRPPDYPRVRQLPLQFITLISGPNAGKKLGVRVSVPADASGHAIAGTFPAMLMQTPYGIESSGSLAEALGSAVILGGPDVSMVERGYVSVFVDTLGTGVSDGEAQLFGELEQQAYGDTVSWITQQSWSNGTIGVVGISGLGITALLTAEQQSPAIKAAFVGLPVGDVWRDTVGIGGLLNGLFVSNWLPNVAGLDNDQVIAMYPQYAAQIRAATQEHVQAIDEVFVPLVNNALTGLSGYATDDGDVWRQRSPLEKASRIQVPTFIIGGNHDIFQRGEPLLYEQLKRNVTTKLVILPGAHEEAVIQAVLGEQSLWQDGPPSSVRLLLQWFDQYLKGMDTGAENFPNVTQYVEGYGLFNTPRYASATDWPHPLARPRRLYLHGDMTVSRLPPADNEETHTVAEPGAPSVTVSGGDMFSLNWIDTDGSQCSVSYLQWTLGDASPQACDRDDSQVENAQNALEYETPVATRDLYFNGPIEADIWMSSSVTAAELSVRLDDVGPDGIATPIANGLMSAAYRAVDSTRSRYIEGVRIQPWNAYTTASALPVVPNSPMLVPVEIFPAAALIRVGHRLRVAISASNQAQGVWPLPEQESALGGVSTIYNDPAHPSSIVLPVVPAAVLPPSWVNTN
jgi:putative CocE/NonD family hydrolase